MLTFLAFSKRQNSVTNDDRKLLPRSDRRVRGTPWRQNISSTYSRAITGASIDGTGKHSTHFVWCSENITTNFFPFSEAGKGPIISQAKRLNVSCTGIGNRGALCRLRVPFLKAQSQQLRHQ